MTTETGAAADGIDPAVVVTGLRTADDSGLPATGTAAPRLSWRLASDRPGVRQAGYEVQVAAAADFGGEAVSSGLVRSSRPLHVPWPAPPLRSREVRWWRVRARTDRGMTGWSEPARVEAALLDQADWRARPITLADDIGRAKPGPVPLLRREFSLSAAAASARLYVTALGLHRVARPAPGRDRLGSGRCGGARTPVRGQAGRARSRRAARRRPGQSSPHSLRHSPPHSPRHFRRGGRAKGRAA